MDTPHRSRRIAGLRLRLNTAALTTNGYGVIRPRMPLGPIGFEPLDDSIERANRKAATVPHPVEERVVVDRTTRDRRKRDPSSGAKLVGDIQQNSSEFTFHA